MNRPDYSRIKPDFNAGNLFDRLKDEPLSDEIINTNVEAEILAEENTIIDAVSIPPQIVLDENEDDNVTYESEEENA